MKTLYLDLISGISGDMFLGSLIDIGVDFAALQSELQRLPVEGYHLHAGRGQKMGISGVKFDVHLVHEHTAESHGDHDDHTHIHEHQHPHASAHGHGDTRTFQDILTLISASPYSSWVKTKAEAVFHRIAVAEGKIHGKPPEAVHFHEVGAMDSIVDIIGGMLAVEMLGCPRITASAVVDGTGWVDCAHGRFPVPVPATLEILGARGVTLSQCDEPHELITPTGAAILAELAESFGPMRGIKPLKIGYGLGGREHATRPNLLRVILGESAAENHDWETDAVVVLETNIDDLNPEILGDIMPRALAAGALDVFHTPIFMKKNRPAVMVSIICAETDADRFSEMLLRETSALGVRRTTWERRKLRREMTAVDTVFGPVKIKRGLLDGQILHQTPEYESCRELAATTGRPVRDIYLAALGALPPAVPQ